MLKNYTRFLLLLSIVFSHSLLFGQSKKHIPYPILFVHGWTGSDATWYEMLVQLKEQGCNLDINQIEKRAGTGSQINFQLNYDLSSTTLNRNAIGPQYGDVLDLMSYVNPDNDVFVINFDNSFPTVQSNQAAIVKQGFAVGLAVRKILQATGADKVVLFGHSMGGLAIREYLQNPENWLTKDNKHHVAKLITSGTPHQGSDITTGNLVKLLFGKDENSDAVRDMRVNSLAGNYLYGGFEGNVPDSFKSKDIDCNGNLNYITGLNHKPMYLNLHFACIVGTGGINIFGWLGTDDDDVVKSYSANIFNLTYDKPMKGDLFVVDNSNQQSGNTLEATWHTKLPTQTFLNQYALDEPAELELAYEIKPNKTYQAFFTPDPKGNDLDYDRFKINFDQRGILDFKTNKDKYGGIQLFNWQGIEIKELQRESRVMIDAGSYSIGIYGATGAASGYPLHFVPYEFATEFCPLPQLPAIVTEGNASICDGEKVTLKLENAGYDSYTWYKDGINVGTGLSVTVNSPGTYSVQGRKCGVSEKSVNEIVLQVKPKPEKPVITIQDNALVSSSEKGNQWFANGTALTGENGQKLTSTGSASYSVKVTENGCTSESDAFTITGLEDPDLAAATVIYPNPATKFIQVKTPLKGELNFIMFDINGKQIRQSRHVNGNSPSLMYVDQKPGIYFLKIESKKGNVTRQFLIQ
ncbi:alpha/beta fold hydrolase [Dyadobacter sediminis]|uniref:Alpha/beta fold hydrolase n=1 Tax=Dyadobacter sediminis TaxID=1493691 RepID=A0A5R9KB78_9BACT|nr:alpha/beta fold hydrolase [Dyadobacter sediminis]TLU91999.1 alpha/beta fold hydrolase [Dyadobacter sediminis]GGB98357.1 hypothetical protein GCM10011325_27050 [Dyadobacter sediminis]